VSDVNQTRQSQSATLSNMGICDDCQRVIRACGCHTPCANDSTQLPGWVIQARNIPKHAWLPVRIGGYREN
jgi:hypothetical protein